MKEKQEHISHTSHLEKAQSLLMVSPTESWQIFFFSNQNSKMWAKRRLLGGGLLEPLEHTSLLLQDDGRKLWLQLWLSLNARAVSCCWSQTDMRSEIETKSGEHFFLTPHPNHFFFFHFKLVVFSPNQLYLKWFEKKKIRFPTAPSWATKDLTQRLKNNNICSSTLQTIPVWRDIWFWVVLVDTLNISNSISSPNQQNLRQNQLIQEHFAKIWFYYKYF